jgi:ribosomal protein S18 acetylase RimI-like enzyme
MASIDLPEIPGLQLRPQWPADEPFLRLLFDASRPLAGQLAHLPTELRETIMRGQFQAQTASLEAQFPQAAALIILVAEEPAGRVMFDATEATLHIADIALPPDRRGQGLGTALLQALAAAAVPRTLSLEVADDNLPAQRLYARLGFVLTGQQPGFLHLARSPSG